MKTKEEISKKIKSTKRAREAVGSWQGNDMERNFYTGQLNALEWVIKGEEDTDENKSG